MAIEEFGNSKEEWFTYLQGLDHGVPSHDTLSDVFALIDSEQFSECSSNDQCLGAAKWPGSQGR